MDKNRNIELKFGNRVKALRNILKITQEELAYRSNLHRNYISDVERGRRNISLIAIYKIAEGLNVSVDALFID
ncbi:MAG: helix-turn-helix transcriptional regulator [Bacilli bacterium]|nr:helix-turn-helix transcriptional regulator [Bacilli bacterium]MDD4123700.1 helix-turn-helix transcriptional regulator [Bacilli bacterium]MDD4584633.1 helix-turn-helix transcriptional regulator [Bacilli bacterium]